MEDKKTHPSNRAKEQEVDYINALDNHIDLMRELKQYAIRRFDLLLVSISTAALGFVITLITTLRADNMMLLKLSCFLFVFTIIFNFLSQITSYNATLHEIRICENLKREAKNEPLIGNQALNEFFLKITNRITIWLNYTSTFFIICALISLVTYVSIYIN